MDKRLSSEQLLDKWEKRHAVNNLMVKFFSQDHILFREKDMYQNYWSKADDVCLTLNDGAYKGKDAVKGYYDALVANIAAKSALIQKKWPNKLGSLSEEEVFGTGLMDMIAIVAPVIEVAADGQTAKGIWTTHGMTSDLTAGGHVSNWVRGYLAADFVWEDDSWKIWHLLYVKDLDHASGSSWEQPQPEYEEDPVFAPVKELTMPEPNVKKTVYETYRADRPFYAPPAYPEPYETFAETFSYGL